MENEIRAFVPEEYWTIEAKLNPQSSKSRKGFVARFYGIDGKKIELHNKEESDRVLELLKDAQYQVSGLKKGTRKRSPAPPFTTSTLQQEASRKLGFQSKRTMSAAQQLYEGVELPKLGAVGLITYMRTDSLRISDEARAAASSYIEEKYGKDYLPASPRIYKTRAGAQDAHEAIRPTMPEMTPESVKENLSADQYKLYKLIWDRFIASQMADAVYDTVAVDIEAAKNLSDQQMTFRSDVCLFKASGFSVRFDGFTTLYVEGKDTDEEKEGMLPVMEKGDLLKLLELGGNQHFTQPPARYTEASLIKMLEENGIGRPSTYAPHHFDYPDTRVCRTGGKIPQTDPVGRGDDQPDDRAFCPDCRSRFHRQDGDRP